MPPKETLHPESPQPTRTYAELKVVGRFKAIAAQVFERGIFRNPPVQATLELTDNASNYRDRGSGQTQVAVILEKDRLTVRSHREVGMGDRELQRVFHMGHSDETGVGTKGVGLKYAAAALGNDLKVEAKLPGDPTRWVIEAKGFGDPTIDYAGTVAIDPHPAPDYEVSMGIVDVTIDHMKWDKPPAASEVRNALAETYRPILIDIPHGWGARVPEPAAFRPNIDAQGQLIRTPDRIAMYVHANKKMEQVVPQHLPIMEGTETGYQVHYTSGGEPVLFRGGIVDTSQPDAKNLRKGIRLYMDGRLVETGVFPEDDTSRDTRVQQRLWGEAHVDHIRGIRDKLQMNKSSGVVRPSEQWDRIQEVVDQACDPLVDQILSLEAKDNPTFSQRFRSEFGFGRKIADAAMRVLLENGDITPHAALGLAHEVTTGQKPPRNGEGDGSSKPGGKGFMGKEWNQQKPKTLLPADADTDIPRRRISPYTPRYAPLDSGETSEINVRGTTTYLTINSEHPINKLQERLATAVPSQSGLIVAGVIAREQWWHLSGELAEKQFGGDPVQRNRIYQAALKAIGKILETDPSWENFDPSHARLADKRKSKK